MRPPEFGPDGTVIDFVHIVGTFQSWLGHALRLAVPRALCGASLAGIEGEPDPGENGAPACPACAGLARRL